jgi:hypothetical protein
VELRLGSAHSFKTNLEIRQTSFPDLSFDAEYGTHPFEDSFYYDWRISRRNSKHAWEFEFLHHKLYLKNNPSEVQHFEVSHGYNMLFVNHAWTVNGFNIRAGGAAVLSHAESEIRNRGFSSDYEFSGIAGQAGVDRRFYLNRHFFFMLEGKFTIAKAKVSIADGEAEVPNIALHGLFGFGVDF